MFDHMLPKILGVTWLRPRTL